MQSAKIEGISDRFTTVWKIKNQCFQIHEKFSCFFIEAKQLITWICHEQGFQEQNQVLILRQRK